MKNRLVLFMILITGFLTFGCTEEVVPHQEALDAISQEMPHDVKATDGEEEPEEEVGNFPKN